jgi:asparagine synthase (glutamine-hydrolysing)
LKVRPIEATTEDYLQCAERVCRATSGTKGAGHWHTYIYPAKAGLNRHDRLFVGANGEFVRTYYLDRGMVARTADLLPPRLGLEQFWLRKVKSEFTGQEQPGLRPQFADYLRGNVTQQIARLAAARPGGSLLRQLDHFYLEERVRHFIANGLVLYGLSARWATPFLSPAWIAEADALPRRWKLGNNWHRYAIANLCPELLEFQEEHVGPTMAGKHPPLYWLPSKRRQKVVPYMDYASVFRDDRVLGLMLDHIPDIADLFDEVFLRELVAQHKARGTRQRLISILLGLAVWRRGAQAATTDTPARAVVATDLGTLGPGSMHSG